MKQTKRNYASRLFYDYKGLETQLESMALKGWKLKKLNNSYIEYEKIDPQPLKYTVTYFWEASEFRPTPTDNQETFVDYCCSGGWELVAKWTQMLIFCATEEDATPIDTDPEQQLFAMDKAMRKGMIPTSYVQIGMFFLIVASRIYSAYSMPEYFYASNSAILMAVVFVIGLCYFIYVPLKYFAWHRRAVETVEAGEEIPSPRWSPKWGKRLAVGLLGGLAISFGFTLRESSSLIIPIYGGFALFLLLIFWISGKLQKSGLLAKIWVRVVVMIAVTIVSTVAFTTLIFTLVGTGVLSSAEVQPELGEPLPLTLEGFTDVDVTGYLYENDVQESSLLKWSDCRQRLEDYGQPYLYYQVFETDCGFVYKHLLADMMRINSNEKNLDEQYKTNWRAVQLDGTTAAYQCYEGDEPKTYDYILCFGTSIVEIRFDSDFTPEQVETAIETLAQKLG